MGEFHRSRLMLSKSLIFLAPFAAAFDKDAAMEKAVTAFNVRQNWQDGFRVYARLIMDDTTGVACSSLDTCVASMQGYFDKIIMDDKTNTYVTVAWCGKTKDSHPDVKGNVWWHDGWDKQLEDTPYYIADENTPTNTKACGDLGMIMRGIEVDNSIAIYASPDYIHTKWDIAHAKPDFDYKPHVNCADYNGASNSFCQKANPCGKADEMQRLWYNDVKAQLRGNKPHMVLTMCHKDGAWSNPENTVPGFPTNVNGLAAARLFEPIGFSNTIREHVEWDKAPKDSGMGDGEGWAPFKFSQCCSTVVIAPQV